MFLLRNKKNYLRIITVTHSYLELRMGVEVGNVILKLDTCMKEVALKQWTEK